MTNIHSTALVDKSVQLGLNVQIGPYCVIDGNVRIGDNTVLKSHVVIDGNVSIGSGNRIFQFASIGHEPQDLTYANEESEVVIGNNNTIREYATINPGTKKDKMITNVGNNCYFMACAHVGHDSVIGSNVVLANNVAIGGHVEIEDHVIVGGNAAVKQFVKIGKLSIVAGLTGVRKNVTPFSMINQDGSLNGLNVVGLRRKKYSNKVILEMNEIFQYVFTKDSSTTLFDRYNNKIKKIIDNNNSLYHNETIDNCIEVANFLEKCNFNEICLYNV